MENKRVLVDRMPALVRLHVQRFRVAGLVLAFATVPLVLYAGDGWTVFETGTPILSAEVNENFAILDGRIGVYEDAITIDESGNLILPPGVGDYGAGRLQITSPGDVIGLTLNSTTRVWDLVSITSAGTDYFAIQDHTARSSRLVIDEKGNLGLGTGSPRVRLDVQGDGAMFENGGAPFIVSPSTGNSTPHTIGAVDNSGEAVILHGAGDVEIALDSNSNGTGDAFRIRGGSVTDGQVLVVVRENTGYVGLGTESPTQRLHVVGKVTADDYLTNSDLRLKTDIAPIENASEGIACLKGVTWHWRAPEASPERQMGLIAQEVEACFPEVVSTDADGYKRISYARLVAPLIENAKQQQRALSEQQELNAAQQALITSQQAEIADMKVRLARLEAILATRQ